MSLFLEDEKSNRSGYIWRELSVSPHIMQIQQLKRFSPALQSRWCLCRRSGSPNERRVEFWDKSPAPWRSFCRCRFCPSAVDNWSSCRFHRRDCRTLTRCQLQRMGMKMFRSRLWHESPDFWLKVKNQQNISQWNSQFLLSLSGVNFSVIVTSELRLSLHTPPWQFDTETSSVFSWRNPRRQKCFSNFFYWLITNEG